MDADPATAIIYDDDAIRVLHYTGDSDELLITFGDLISLAKDKRFFADKPARKLGLSTIGIMAKSEHWYRTANIADALEAVLAASTEYTTRTLYGASMGGYAALKYSRLLRATHVIALCPQWSLDRRECGGVNPGWQFHFAEPMRGMGIRAEDIGGTVHILADPFSVRDRFHYRQLQQACPSLHFVSVPHVGHHITGTIAGTANLERLIALCQAADARGLRHFSRRVRRTNGVWRKHVLAYVGARLPARLGRVVSDLCHAGGDVPALAAPAFIAALAHEMDRGGVDAACVFYDRFSALMASPLDQLRACACLARAAGADIVIVTPTGTRLVGDVAAQRCRHTAQPRWHDSPLQLRLSGSDATLSCAMANATFDIQADAGGILGFAAEARPLAAAPVFALVAGRRGTFHLVAADAHLACTPNGDVVVRQGPPDQRAGLRFSIDRHAEVFATALPADSEPAGAYSASAPEMISISSRVILA